jgi:hypothetical protein
MAAETGALAGAVGVPVKSRGMVDGAAASGGGAKGASARVRAAGAKARAAALSSVRRESGRRARVGAAEAVWCFMAVGRLGVSV